MILKYFDFLLIAGYDVKEINKHLQSSDFRFKFSESKCKERQNQQIIYF